MSTNFITAEQIQEINENPNTILSKIKLLIDSTQFNVGDYVIKKTRSYDWDNDKYHDEWETDTIYSVPGCPQKYLCVYIDGDGARWLKELEDNSLEGIENTEPFSVLSSIDLDDDTGEQVMFTVDPDYQDHLLIGGGEPFDPAESIKKFEEKVEKLEELNASIGNFIGTLKEGEEYLRALKIGDVVYSEHGTFTVTKIETNKVKKKDHWFKKYMAYGMEETTLVTGDFVDEDGDKYENTMHSTQMQGETLYSQKPFTIDQV